MIKIENGTKEYKKRKVLDNINITFEDKGCYVLRGVNGSGKTLILKAICGYIKLTSGTVYQDDKRIREDRDFIDNAGIVIEHPEFLKDLSIINNLVEIASIKKVVSKEKILELMEWLNIKKDMDTKYKNCSLGMKQKMRIIQAIMEEPAILILDEILDSLDKKSVDNVREYLMEYKKNKLIIMTSHNSEDVKILADTIIEIEEGQIVS